MKLRLKHLAAYLPHNLQLLFEKSGRVISMQSCYNDGFLHVVDCNEGNDYDLRVWNFKPILRPLSDLTKEIEVNGERFIPMVYLFVNFCKVSPDKYSLDVGRNLILMDIQQDFHEWYFVYHIQEKIFEFSKKDEASYRNLNQYEMFELLKSWHFDIFGLIEAGLAVDINSVKF